jgi:hypothetical protein
MPNILSIIEEYGLSIRKIPDVVTSLYTLSALQRSNSLREDDVVFAGPSGREMVKRYRVPKYAGYWMCQQVFDTDSTVVWSYARHHLKPTLEESVLDFLDYMESEA